MEFTDTLLSDPKPQDLDEEQAILSDADEYTTQPSEKDTTHDIDNTTIMTNEELIVQTSICFLASILPGNTVLPNVCLEKYKEILSEKTEMEFSTSTNEQIISVRNFI